MELSRDRILEEASQILNTAGLTKDMTDREQAALAELGEKYEYKAGDQIVQEGAKSRDLFVIIRGKVTVRIALPTDNGKEEVVYTMREGNVFGELSLVDGSPRSASVIAEEKVVALKFTFDDLGSLMDDFPRIGYLLMRNIASIISSRIRNTNLLWRNSLIW